MTILESGKSVWTKRVGRTVVGLALAFVLVSSGAYWWLIGKQRSEFAALQSRAEVWGGRIHPSLNLQSPLMRFRGNGPSFVDPLLGIDGYHVSIHGMDPTLAQLGEVLSVSPIRSISIAATPRFTDELILGIDDPAAIRGLHLNDVNLTDRSLATIERMKNLSEVSLVGTSISDSTAARIVNPVLFPKINNVYLGSPNIRSIRLLEAVTCDATGKPTLIANSATHFRGRIAIESRFGKPGNVRIMVSRNEDGPHWDCHPYGWNASRQGAGLLAEDSPGIWSFDIAVGGIPEGESKVAVWVDQMPATGPVYVHYRLTPFLIHLGTHDPRTFEGPLDPDQPGSKVHR